MNETAPSFHGEALAARHAALFLLSTVLDRKTPLDQALEESRDLRALPARDRAFIRMIVATALRRMGQIDDFIRRASERNEPPQPPLLHHLLRTGATQIAFMDVPDYAAADTSVRLAEESGLAKQKGFVNAVLRRIAREHRDWAGKQDAPRMNAPEWLMRAWIDDYGLRAAAEIAQANMAEAPLDITIKNPGMKEYWLQTLQASALPSGTLRRAAGGAVHELPGFDDGMWWVQDAASALPAQLFGNIEGKTVIDLCAAPGGKTAQMAAAGAHVVALDRSAARMKRLADNLRRLRLDKNVRIEIADGAEWKPKESAQFILCDAPCTATGTIRRHPDVAHLKSAQDMARLAATQTRLLDNAAAMLAPGGILVYCTCSLQKDEGERQIESLLTRRADIRRMPVTAAETGGIEGIIDANGDVRILPFHLAAMGGMDGFFIGRLQKA
ncbi:MAG: RsmB/NOP family class I SAM-dependent RNA methyltransferase [Proteobacteria bacterium]|nr:RsmB/NOP family class I SAM-dependent RNA methyltransferase [Pseudomonadota bacterium]